MNIRKLRVGGWKEKNKICDECIPNEVNHRICDNGCHCFRCSDESAPEGNHCERCWNRRYNTNAEELLVAVESGNQDEIKIKAEVFRDTLSAEYFN